MKITSKEHLHMELANTHVRIIKARVSYETAFYKSITAKHVARRDMNIAVAHLRDKIRALKLSFRINAESGA